METLTSFSAKEASWIGMLGVDVQEAKAVESTTIHVQTLRKKGDSMPFSL